MATRAIQAAVRAQEIARSMGEEARAIIDSAQNKVAEVELKTWKALRKAEAGTGLRYTTSNKEMVQLPLKTSGSK